MNKTVLGILLGAVAGIIDVIPMIFMKLTWDANISAFTMWVIIGYFLSSIESKCNPILKGIVVSFLVLLPSAILIGWNDPKSLIPIIVMTTILGSLLGYSINRLTK
jgi:hypothetical protein